VHQQAHSGNTVPRLLCDEDRRDFTEASVGNANHGAVEYAFVSAHNLLRTNKLQFRIY
jgi:hypothetical protein